jgi:ketosteroid isomerase-like protein
VNQTRYYTAQEAEAAFYGAFQNRDVDAMMAVWAEDDDILCIHPTGPVLAGRAAIQDSWRGIFQHSSALKFFLEERQRLHDGSLQVHVVQEYIRVGDDPPQSPVFATNVYRLTDSGWRMVLHHASPSPKPKKQTQQTLH